MVDDSGHDEKVNKVINRITLMRYCLIRYMSGSGSLYVSGLAYGLFLGYMLDHDEEGCEDKPFTEVFFYIGLLNFIGQILSMLSEYAKEVFMEDGSTNKTEELILFILYMINQLLRIIEVVFLFNLGYKLIVRDVIEKEKWSYRRSDTNGTPDNCTICYCPKNFVITAHAFFGFHIFLAVVVVLLWTAMWLADSDDEEQERLDEAEWLKKEERFSQTILGKIMNFLLMLGIQGFFSKQIARAMYNFALASPFAKTCKTGVTSSFLAAGLASIATEVFENKHSEVISMAKMDGVVNSTEQKIIMSLKYMRCASVGCEIIFWAMIFEELIVFDHDTEDDGDESYCSKKVLHFLTVGSVMYSFVLGCRVVFALTASLESKKGEKTVAELQNQS